MGDGPLCLLRPLCQPGLVAQWLGGVRGQARLPVAVPVECTGLFSHLGPQLYYEWQVAWSCRYTVFPVA